MVNLILLLNFTLQLISQLFAECQISTHPPESIFIELRIVGKSHYLDFHRDESLLNP